jgi:hypothetical protein
MDPEDRFWDLAEELLLTRTGVTRSTMMGFPCLRINGGFFAALDRKNGHLVVKLPAERVTRLVATGAAVPFAPAGRTFREWAAILMAAVERWPGLLEEALTFVASIDQPRPQRQRTRSGGRSRRL